MIKLKNINIRFQEEVIFSDFSLTLNKGQSLAVTGKSGKGKSTLLNLLAGFVPDFSGSAFINNIELNYQNINEIRKLIAWLPQDMALNFKTVKELFYAPFSFVQNKSIFPKESEIAAVFKAFDLPNQLLLKNNKEISGGQRQRILLASCILLKKPILLIDEPTSALDDDIKQKVADYILNLKDITVIAVTNDKYWIEKSDIILKI